MSYKYHLPCSSEPAANLHWLLPNLWHPHAIIYIHRVLSVSKWSTQSCYPAKCSCNCWMKNQFGRLFYGIGLFELAFNQHSGIPATHCFPETSFIAAHVCHENNPRKWEWSATGAQVALNHWMAIIYNLSCGKIIDTVSPLYADSPYTTYPTSLSHPLGTLDQRTI